jgi:Fe-S-cluster-containing hydrogenase component 2/bacterioferritin-associated ferredoxin
MMEKIGFAAPEELSPVTPPKERRARGPVVMVECLQKIPCNPCATACARGAIERREDINELPAVNWEKCNGCGVCISKCPGLAIFVVDETYSESEALVKLPYEFLPLPKEGDYVTGIDRSGRPACQARVVKVQNGKAQDKTPVISVAVPKNMALTVRSIRLEDYFGDPTLVCRCEEITLGELRRLLSEGFTSLDEIKRLSRCGMGPCQGKTCGQIAMREIASFTGAPMEDVKPAAYRPPVKPIRLDFFLKELEEDEHA